MLSKTKLSCLAAMTYVCTNAYAQSSVTLYGVADSTVELVRTTGANKGADLGWAGREVSNSSAWGMKGQEDLGGGLAAIFQIEYGYNVNSGSGPSARDQFVGLRSDAYGTLQFGYVTSPMRGLGGKLNFIPGSTSIANDIGVMTTLNGTQTNLNARLANSIMYTSPLLLQGLNAQFIYSPGGGNTSPTNSSVSGTAGSPNNGMYAWGAGAQYAKGPLYAAYAYETRRDQDLLGAGAGLSGAGSAGMGVAATGYSNDWEHRVAVRYEANFFGFGSTTFGVGWDRLGSTGTFGTGKAAGAGQTYRDAFSVAVMQKVGLQEFIFNYAVSRPLSCSGAATNGQCSAAEQPHTGAQQMVFAYHYWLSKRTMLQGYVSRIHNSSFATYDYDTNPVVTAVANRAPGASPVGVGFGIRHYF
ncbi:MAG: porin [Pseudomonadota bacterium]|jgi:predicted porin|uniref:porin n=1 Tax=Burkholderiaceae TaxID=119060 RepID=UPI0010F6E40F|nr:porin [Burkholderia sp. 4M9327F10]